MTDQKMDDRLRAAGARWREENVPAVAEDSPDDEILVHLPSPRRSRTRWLTAASAAVVAAALVVGGVYVVRHKDSGNGNQNVAAPAAELVGPTWSLPDTSQTLVFSDSQLKSKYACSTTTNELAIDGTTLHLGRIVGSPGEVCSPPAPTPAAQRQLTLLQKVVSGDFTWSVERNTLTLSKQGVGAVDLTRPVQLADLQGVNWGVTGTNDSLVFGNDDTVRLYGGCVFGTYRAKVSGSTVTLGSPLGTPVACATPVDRNGSGSTPDAKFGAITTGSFTISLAGNTLTISKSGKGSMALTPQGAVPELQGTLWKLTGIHDKNGSSLARVSGSTTLQIDGSGKLTTDDQCGNGIGGMVDISDTTFGFRSPPARTEIGCADRVLNNGAVIVGNVFDHEVRWTIENKTLVLSNAYGVLLYTATTPVPPQQVSLPGTSWNLTNLQLTSNAPNSAVSMMPAVGDTTLTFTDNGFTLGDGCYQVTGTVAYATGALTLSSVHGGQNAGARCDANTRRIQQEDDLGKLLSDGGVTWVFSNNTLSLSAYNVTAAFGRASTTSTGNSALTTSNWTLTDTSTQSTSGNSSTGGGSSAITRSDLVFSADGTFTLAHKCYSMVGKYTVDAKTITFSDVHGADQLPCPSNAEPVGGQEEDDFVDAVLANGATTFSIDKGSLALTRKNDTADFASQANGAAALRASHWELGEIHQGGASLQPSYPIEFGFATKVIGGGHMTVPARIGDGTITITGGAVDDDKAAPDRLSKAQQTFVFDKVLQGKVTYTLIGDELTITKAGVGAIVLTKKS